MNPLISVIVPTYNHGIYLPETLESVTTQSFTDWECIIVDDGSTDNTENIANEFCQKDSRFKYFFKNNGGLSAARNTGIRKSSGEYVLPLDADDLIGNTYLEKAIKRFIEFPDTKLVYCKAEIFGDIVKNWELEEYNYEKLLFSNMIFCSAIFRKKDFDITVGYNENMIYGLEDWDFWITLLDENSIVYQIPETLFYYRIKENSMNRSMSDEMSALMERQIVNNHKNKYEKYIPNIIEFVKNKQEEPIIYLKNELIKIQASKAYRVGKFLVGPFSKIKSLFDISRG
jgi:glycosyltransferase involved in cell wall biosynthesis